MVNISYTILMSSALFASIYMTSVSLQEINKLALIPHVDSFIWIANVSFFTGSSIYLMSTLTEMNYLINNK